MQTPHVTQRYFCFQILQTIRVRLPHAALMKPIEEEGGGVPRLLRIPLLWFGVIVAFFLLVCTYPRQNRPVPNLYYYLFACSSELTPLNIHLVKEYMFLLPVTSLLYSSQSYFNMYTNSSFLSVQFFQFPIYFYT